MPKVVDHEQRRAELVEATWHVVADEGIEAATIRRIAEAAGCTTGGVTHYFASKDDLLVAALQAVHGAAADRMLVHVRRGGPNVLRNVLLEALPVDEASREEWRVWLAFWGRASTHPRLVAEQARRYDEWRALLDSLVPRPSTRAARRTQVDLLAATIDGLGIQASLEPDRFPRPRLTRLVSALLDQLDLLE